MPEVYRETRYTRERDRSRSSSSSSDEGGYKKTTVRRYKVTPSRSERIEREIDVIDEDRRSRHGGRSQVDVIDVDRRVDRIYVPERPRSTVDFERERERDRDERYSRVEYRDERPRVIERDDSDYYRFEADRDRGRFVFEKSKEIERYDRRDTHSPHSPHGDWERRSYWDPEKEAEVTIQRRVERRDNGEVVIERRVEERGDGHEHEVERWRKETEYYEPAPAPPAPIVIRQKAPEQRIIVQEAAPPAPLIIREQPEIHREVIVARRPEVNVYERHEEEIVTEEHFDDHRPHSHSHSHSHSHHRRHHRHRDEAESDDEHYYRKTSTRRDSSGSPHRKRHIAEGALAGAGISALLASQRSRDGEFKDNRGRKVVAGAALGALGTEVVRRAHSAYQEHYGDEDEHRSRSRSGDRTHSRIKTGLGIAAVALAAAGAAKYIQTNKVEKEELSRGRSRRRYSDSEYSRSPSRKRSKSRAGSVAKAAAGTAAVAGLVQHFRNRSKSRDGKSRSRSRLRTGAEIVGAGLVGAGAKKLYDRRQDKKERERELSDEEAYERDARDYRRRSRSRSLSRFG